MSAANDLEALTMELENAMKDFGSSLSSITSVGLNEYVKEMSMIDKAKAHALVLYALNSAVFSALKVGGYTTVDHGVMSDISRVRTYMAKIKNAEELVTGRQLQVDKKAAGRFIKHALSGNDAYDDDRDQKRVKA
ncbi:hypothetical protein V1512DRAFT_189647, partial [Lipomyces arxii]|uniref:uncharacterized protein n=1 Tax=Lipomyces arxii TaxID=56418 RepID=UPI0034CE7E60